MYDLRAKSCIMACWNMFIPYLVPDIPAKQKEALAYGVKGPLVYTSVAVKNWQAWQKLGISSINAATMYHPSVSLTEAVSLGDLKHPQTPDDPVVLHLTRMPSAPGKPRKEQHRIGRAELLATSFETFERNIRDQLARNLAGGGFDPARDIVAITVNRWPHGYANGFIRRAIRGPAWWLGSLTD
jgi:spermidine dehydrogenase